MLYPFPACACAPLCCLACLDPLPEPPEGSDRPTAATPDFLPSTDRSESILQLLRSKSETSLPQWEPLRASPSPRETPYAGVGDNTLSIQSDLEEDPVDDILAPIATIPQARPRKVDSSENTASNSLSFVSATNGVVVRLGGPGGEQRVSSYVG